MDTRLLKKIFDHLINPRSMGYYKFVWNSVVTQKIKRWMKIRFDNLLFSERPAVLPENKVTFFTMVWGKKHVDMLFNYCIPSLLQSNNAPRLSKLCKLHHLFYLYQTDLDYIQQNHKEKFAELSKLVDVEIIFLENLSVKYEFQKADHILLHAIEKCIERASYWFACAPDHIFGNGSITNMYLVAYPKPICIAAGQPRVSYEKFKAADFEARLSHSLIENRDLVAASFDYGHPSFLNCFEDQEMNTTGDGCAIRKLNNHTYQVIYNVPNLWLVFFTTADIEFFKKNSFNYFDKVWPRELFKEHRIKYLPSSDLFFAVELTFDHEKKPCLRSGRLYNDEYLTPVTNMANYVANAVINFWTVNRDI